MLNFKYASSKSQKHLTKMSLFIINFILLSTLIPISIHAAPGNDPNVVNVIEFNHKKFKAGNFATNKNGDLFIEYYSEAAEDTPVSRLFYGRTKEGREIFFNESSYTQEIGLGLDETIDISEHLNYFKIYSSKNLFVTIKNEANKENQYLFSINSYDWSVELHKFNNNINTEHYLWNFNDFFNLNEKKYRFRYETVLLELKADSSYVIAFLPKDNVNDNMKELSFIKKFKFKSFAEDAYEEIESIKYDDYISKAILSVFLYDDSFLAVVSMEIEEEEEYNDVRDNLILTAKSRNLQDYSFKFTLNFYYSDLDSFEFGNNNILYIEGFNYFPLDDLFFKTIYLKKGFTIFAWISRNYYYNPYNPYNYNFNIGLYKLDPSSGGYPTSSVVSIKMSLTYIEEILSDFVKINDRRIVFILTNTYLLNEGDDSSLKRRRNQEIEIEGLLNILIIDIQSDYSGINIPQIYYTRIDNYIPVLQISEFYYNDYLLFSSTAISIEDSYNFNEDDSNYLSIFMIFGYPNGKDNDINILEYLNIEVDSSEGLYDKLYKYLTIENNIFGYELDKIRLISIPNELIIIPVDNE